MPAVALVGDEILGMTAGEHSGHIDPPHPPLTITGYILSSAQSKAFLGGILLSVTPSVTMEFDGCCGSSTGLTAEASSKMFVEGMPVNRLGDAIAPHNGTAEISTGHDKMMVGG